MISRGVDKVIEIRKELESGSLAGIRKAFGSMYPEKTYFQDEKVRTARRNDFFEGINLVNSKLIAKKIGTKVGFSTLSRLVGVAGFEPATSWSQTRRDDRATLHPEKNISGANISQIYFFMTYFNFFFIWMF